MTGFRLLSRNMGCYTEAGSALCTEPNFETAAFVGFLCAGRGVDFFRHYSCSPSHRSARRSFVSLWTSSTSSCRRGLRTNACVLSSSDRQSQPVGCRWSPWLPPLAQSACKQFHWDRQWGVYAPLSRELIHASCSLTRYCRSGYAPPYTVLTFRTNKSTFELIGSNKPKLK